MIFDLEVIQARLTIIEQNLDHLSQIPQRDFNEFVADFRNIEAAKHLLQTAIEAIIDICSHCVARLRLKVPGNGAQLVQALADAGWLPAENAVMYARMIRFRNLVVHVYVEVDDHEIYNILQNHLNEFHTFVGDAWRMVQRDQSAGQRREA